MLYIQNVKFYITHILIESIFALVELLKDFLCSELVMSVKSVVYARFSSEFRHYLN